MQHLLTVIAYLLLACNALADDSPQYIVNEKWSGRSRGTDNFVPTLNTNRGAAQQTDEAEEVFVLNGTEQPVVGHALSVSTPYLDNTLGLSFRWIRGDALGIFDDADILSDTPTYIIKDSDDEHWLRVTVCDSFGNVVFTKDTWISKLPVLYIDTEDGKPITSKTNYKTACLRIQGNAEYEQQYVGQAEVKGRGATSWAKYPQKPYKLKLNTKTKLFGFPKSKHWVLISNFNDKSCLRNYIASKLAKQLGVLGMDMTWVDVVLNGEANLYGHIKWLDKQFQSVKTLIEAMNKVCAYPCDPNIIDGIENPASDKQPAARKVVRDKHLYIIKDGITYSIDGKITN